MSWDDKQKKQVETLLMCFNGADEIAACTGTPLDGLNAECMAAFGMDFEATQKLFAAKGRANLRGTIYEEALNGSAKAMEMLAREQLGMGAVELRKKTAAAAQEAAEKPETHEADVLKLVLGTGTDG